MNDRVKTKEHQDRLAQIRSMAADNQGTISYVVAVDLLKDKTEPNKEDLLQWITEIENEGIEVVHYEGQEGYPADDADAETFIPADVHIETKPATVQLLMDRLENTEIDLQPCFQRKSDLWSNEQQSRLIESLMLKIPLPAFYFDAADDENWKVIDGLQRLSAFRNFLVGVEDENQPKHWIKRKFEGMEYLPEFNGKDFDQLPRQYVRRIKESQIIIYTVEKGTPEEVVFNIFKRINTGGMTLTDQEIRQALYQGKSIKLVEELAKSKEFIEATQGAISNERMLDREYVTRYLAFTELDYEKKYKDNINAFLNQALSTTNGYSAERLEQIGTEFKARMALCHAVFGKYAFRTYNAEGRRGPINKAVFELWAICFDDLSPEQEKMLVEDKGRLLSLFGQLLQKDSFRSALGSGKISSLKKRVEDTKEMLEVFYAGKDTFA